MHTVQERERDEMFIEIIARLMELPIATQQLVERHIARDLEHVHGGGALPDIWRLEVQ